MTYNRPYLPFKRYPFEVAAFHRMQDRVHRGYTTTTWARTLHGFWAFFKSVGPIPKNMKDPSLGRIDHSKGYQAKNCIWQDRRKNNGEPWSRPEVQKIQKEARDRLFNKPGIREYYAVMLKQRHKKIWTPENRRAMSQRMKGNHHACKTS